MDVTVTMGVLLRQRSSSQMVSLLAPYDRLPDENPDDHADNHKNDLIMTECSFVMKMEILLTSLFPAKSPLRPIAYPEDLNL